MTLPRVRRSEGARVALTTVTLREGTAADVDAIAALIDAHAAEGHLLPRTREDIARHASRFDVVAVGEQVIGCADIAPLSTAVGEIRSLVIGGQARGAGIGRLLIARLVERAAAQGFRTVCAFTSAPGFFVQSGFSIVPHTWLPDKIATDCRSCPRFRSCGQYGVMLSIR